MDGAQDDSADWNFTHWFPTFVRKLLPCLQDEDNSTHRIFSRVMRQKYLSNILQEVNVVINELCPSKIAISPDCWEYLYLLMTINDVQFTPEEQTVLNKCLGQYYHDKEDLIQFADILYNYSANDYHLAYGLNLLFAVDGLGKDFHYRYYLNHLQYTLTPNDKIHDNEFLHVAAVRSMYHTLKRDNHVPTPSEIQDALSGFLKPLQFGNDTMKMYVTFLNGNRNYYNLQKESVGLMDVVSLIEERVKKGKMVENTETKKSAEGEKFVGNTEGEETSVESTETRPSVEGSMEDTEEGKVTIITQKGRKLTAEEKLMLRSDEEKFMHHKKEKLLEQARRREERRRQTTPTHGIDAHVDST